MSTRQQNRNIGHKEAWFHAAAKVIAKAFSKGFRQGFGEGFHVIQMRRIACFMRRIRFENSSTGLNISRTVSTCFSTPVSTNSFLNTDEIAHLTGAHRPIKQANWLAKRGVPFVLDGRSRLVVYHSHVQAMMEGTASRRSSGPNWDSKFFNAKVQ